MGRGRKRDLEEAAFAEEISARLNAFQGPPRPPSPEVMEVVAGMRSLAERVRGLNAEIRRLNDEMRESLAKRR